MNFEEGMRAITCFAMVLASAQYMNQERDPGPEELAADIESKTLALVALFSEGAQRRQAAARELTPIIHRAVAIGETLLERAHSALAETQVARSND
jgi:hypothetical protein